MIKKFNVSILINVYISGVTISELMDRAHVKTYIRMKKMISPLKKILEDQLRILKFKVKLNFQKLTQSSVQNRTLTQPRIL